MTGRNTLRYKQTFKISYHVTAVTVVHQLYICAKNMHCKSSNSNKMTMMLSIILSHVAI